LLVFDATIFDRPFSLKRATFGGRAAVYYLRRERLISVVATVGFSGKIWGMGGSECSGRGLR